MQEVALALSANPALTLATGVVAGALLVLVSQWLRARTRPSTNALQGLFTKESLGEEMDKAADRRSFAGRSGAVLRARVDHLPQVGQLWGLETRSAAIAQVAQVMRAGVRSEDAVKTVSDDPDTLEIHTGDVSEVEAGAIARRLLDTLAQMPMPGMAPGMRVSASFGVAARQPGESEEEARQRAEVALAAAQAAGEDSVMTAGEWEEIKLLPAPEPSPAKDSKAA
ncbi:hypothetical protein NAP1_02305 [Erythrobacter sp. NAP1]|uniref:GGDEF domain-containing protein n=1 Tax=Erythrobacter sp. NAP1 TaxID=237727 RepID=UPI00006869DC|nr:diguanylate cyclase [Erythrobacter sp. NAP1]EAQ29567.1 hypothetical protein NAP1_02305 [Erythrobacter sp. NAP1]